jgi:hypothetical protein
MDDLEARVRELIQTRVDDPPGSAAYEDASYDLLVIRYEYEEGGWLIEDNDPLEE